MKKIKIDDEIYERLIGEKGKLTISKYLESLLEESKISSSSFKQKI